MRVLVACEESQVVCKAFRAKGHEAYSCDILPCSGGHPEWHILDDIRNVLTRCDRPWDMLLAFPPCTYLTITANKWLKDQPALKSGALVGAARRQAQEKAVEFFMDLANAEIGRIAIENPIGCVSTRWRKPDQIVHPYHFGDPERKATCLWLKGLPVLTHTNVVQPIITQYKNGKGTDSLWHMDTLNLPPAERSRARSKTFPGIAAAMAEQWG